MTLLGHFIAFFAKRSPFVLPECEARSPALGQATAIERRQSCLGGRQVGRIGAETEKA